MNYQEHKDLIQNQKNYSFANIAFAIISIFVISSISNDYEFKAYSRRSLNLDRFRMIVYILVNVTFLLFFLSSILNCYILYNMKDDFYIPKEGEVTTKTGFDDKALFDANYITSIIAFAFVVVAILSMLFIMRNAEISKSDLVTSVAIITAGFVMFGLNIDLYNKLKTLM